MDSTTADWLDRISMALAEARAALGCFGIDAPELTMRIEAALEEAFALKNRIQMPSSD